MNKMESFFVLFVAALVVTVYALPSHEIVKREEPCCQVNDTFCAKDGQKWNDEGSCVTYKCVKSQQDGSTYFSQEFDKVGCKLADGSCKDDQATWDVGCATYTCIASISDDGAASARTAITQMRCKLADGSCKGGSDTWNVGCIKYTCDSSITADGAKARPKEIEIQCPDADKKCRSVGETFPYIIGGKRYPNCKCTVNGRTVNYSCGSK